MVKSSIALFGPAPLIGNEGLWTREAVVRLANGLRIRNREALQLWWELLRESLEACQLLAEVDFGPIEQDGKDCLCGKSARRSVVMGVRS